MDFQSLDDAHKRHLAELVIYKRIAFYTLAKFSKRKLHTIDKNITKAVEE